MALPLQLPRITIPGPTTLGLSKPRNKTDFWLRGSHGWTTRLGTIAAIHLQRSLKARLLTTRLQVSRLLGSTQVRTVPAPHLTQSHAWTKMEMELSIQATYLIVLTTRYRERPTSTWFSFRTLWEQLHSWPQWSVRSSMWPRLMRCGFRNCILIRVYTQERQFSTWRSNHSSLLSWLSMALQ